MCRRAVRENCNQKQDMLTTAVLVHGSSHASHQATVTGQFKSDVRTSEAWPACCIVGKSLPLLHGKAFSRRASSLPLAIMSVLTVGVTFEHREMCRKKILMHRNSCTKQEGALPPLRLMDII